MAMARNSREETKPVRVPVSREMPSRKEVAQHGGVVQRDEGSRHLAQIMAGGAADGRPAR